MCIRHRRVILSAAAALGANAASLAQWSTDPGMNTPVSTASNQQDLCKVAATSDGGCWIAWFSSIGAPNNYAVRVQRLDAAGVGQLGPDGLLVSDKPSLTFTAGDWDLRVDGDNNALVCFNDVRPGTAGGTDREISAYRIAPDGTMLWGADGVLLSDDLVDEFDSRICQTTDGLFTVVFSRTNSGTTPPRGLVMQRLDASGNKLLGPDGVLIAGSGVGGALAADGPGFFQMIPSDNGSVICFYGRDTRTATSQRYPTIQKYDATGAGLWNGGNAIVLQTSAWPIGSYPGLVSDGMGGAIVTWADSRSGNSRCYVQRLDSSGAAAFPAGGTATAITAGRLHFEPTAPVPGPEGEVYVFWSFRDSGQGTRAVHGQRFDAAGNRVWGDDGLMLTAFDTDIETFIRAVAPPCGSGGAIVSYEQTPTASTADTVLGFRVDGAGNHVWSPAHTVVSSVASSKGRYPVAALSDSSLVIVWSDNRSDAGDIYAQKLNADGTLGGSTLCPADFNRSGTVSVQDIFDFLAAYFTNDPCADFNRSGAVSVQDIFDYLSAYFTPCP